MVYTLSELKRIVAPIAEKYSISEIYLFGSYARGDATESSDIDFLINREGSSVQTLLDIGAVYNDLNEAIAKPIDLVTLDGLDGHNVKRRAPGFPQAVHKEKVRLL